MASADENRRLSEQFWQRMNENDWRAAAELFHDAFTLDWPQSGERVRGRDNFVRVNAGYPAAGPWVFTVHRIVADERGAVSDVTVTDGANVARALSFFEIQDGTIRQVTEFWPEPFAAPEWRASWVERFDAGEPFTT